MIEYRKANIADIENLVQMRMAMLCEGTDLPEKFRVKLHDNTMEYFMNGLLENNFIVWIAVNGGEIVAMSGLTFYILPPNDLCPNGKTAYIGNVYTLPAFRKQGIAAKLIPMLIEEAKQDGCERILLNTTDAGRSLYEKLGFENSPTAMAFYP